MNKYEILFTGRLKGALGVRSQFTVEVEAPGFVAAHLKLYEKYEHIRIHYVMEIE